jgi:hypothetical protein
MISSRMAGGQGDAKPPHKAQLTRIAIEVTCAELNDHSPNEGNKNEHGGAERIEIEAEANASDSQGGGFQRPFHGGRGRHEDCHSQREYGSARKRAIRLEAWRGAGVNPTAARTIGPRAASQARVESMVVSGVKFID